jgi:hypothetical protein
MLWDENIHFNIVFYDIFFLSRGIIEFLENKITVSNWWDQNKKLNGCRDGRSIRPTDQMFLHFTLPGYSHTDLILVISKTITK